MAPLCGSKMCESNSSTAEGAGNTGCTLHPRSRVQKCTTKTHTSIQVQRRQSGIPCAMVLTAASCSPRRSGFLVTVISSSLTADLTPASRRQDHTTWHVRNKSAFVSSAPLRPPHPHPAYATIMIRPSVGVGCESYSLICASGKQKYFCERD